MWWSSNSSNDAVKKPSEVDSQPAPPQDSTDKLTTPVKQQLSRDEQASLEFAEFFKEIEIETSKSLEAKGQVRTDGKTEFSIPGNISADALYPKQLNCRSAFDYAMFCQSFGGQFVNVYRYGEFRKCSNHWSDFWLCMRTKNWDEKDRAKAVQDHYRTKAVKWKTGPSSEDVWEVRTEPVKNPFSENYEKLEAEIEEWKAANPDAPDPWDNSRTTGSSASS